MIPNDVIKKLEECKGCEKIRITTIENRVFDVNYKDIINDTKQELIFINALFDWDKRMFLYCAIKSIQPE